MAERLVGFHLHDVSPGGRDHRVPGTGLADFKMIAEFVRPEHVLVLELSLALWMRCCSPATIWRRFGCLRHCDLFACGSLAL